MSSRKPTSHQTVGIVALLGGVICWGITPVLLRSLTSSIDAWTANGLRYPMAAILYWPILFYSIRSGGLNIGLARKCCVPALLALGGQVFWALSHYELQASEIGFLVRLTLVWTLLGSMLLFRDERQLLRNPVFYGGFALLMVGFTLMALPGGGGAPNLSARGLIWMGLCIAFFGSYMLSVRVFIPKAHPLIAFGVVSQIVSMGTLLGMFLFGDLAIIGEQTPSSWLTLIGSSMLGIALGHILMYTSIQRLGATITSACQTLMPLVTATVAGLWLGETLEGRQWSGGLVMIVGATMLLSIRQLVADNN